MSRKKESAADLFNSAGFVALLSWFPLELDQPSISHKSCSKLKCFCYYRMFWRLHLHGEFNNLNEDLRFFLLRSAKSIQTPREAQTLYNLTSAQNCSNLILNKQLVSSFMRRKDRYSWRSEGQYQLFIVQFQLVIASVWYQIKKKNSTKTSSVLVTWNTEIAG